MLPMEYFGIAEINFFLYIDLYEFRDEVYRGTYYTSTVTTFLVKNVFNKVVSK